MKDHGKYFPAKETSPISVSYCPNIDVSNELGPQEATYLPISN